VVEQYLNFLGGTEQVFLTCECRRARSNLIRFGWDENIDRNNLYAVIGAETDG